MEEFFGRNFWEDFFGRIFLEDFFLEDYWEDFFGRNSLFTLELTCLSRFWGNERKEVEFSILRSAIVSSLHLKLQGFP